MRPRWPLTCTYFTRGEYTIMRRSVRFAVAAGLGVGILLVAGEAGAQYRYAGADGVSKVVQYKLDVPADLPRCRGLDRADRNRPAGPQ